MTSQKIVNLMQTILENYKIPTTKLNTLYCTCILYYIFSSNDSIELMKGGFSLLPYNSFQKMWETLFEECKKFLKRYDNKFKYNISHLFGN